MFLAVVTPPYIYQDNYVPLRYKPDQCLPRLYQNILQEVPRQFKSLQPIGKRLEGKTTEISIAFQGRIHHIQYEKYSTARTCK